jgi:uncharacterized membrane protein
MQGPDRAHSWAGRWRRVVLAQVATVPKIAAALALLAYLASDTPSLLPRPWYLQGLISGILAVSFYAIGTVVDDLRRVLVRWADLRVSIGPRARRLLTFTVTAALSVGLLVYPFVRLAWRNAETQYVGEPGPGPFYPVASALTTLAVVAVFVALFRIITRLFRWLTLRVERRVVREVAGRVIASILTIIIVVVVFDQIVVRGLLAVAAQQANSTNATLPGGLAPPASPLRSGGPGSLVTWKSLGSDGASFVSSGPSRSAIETVVGHPAKEPIRVFVGVGQNRTLEQTKELALAELDRTHAFDRKAIIVVTSTSTGFVNEWAAESVEFLLSGDTAIVTMQYSTLPSATALITDQGGPPAVGRLLFDAVAARVKARPADRRPKLYVGGESVGAYGGNGAFDSSQDMIDKIDGAVWTGTPSFTPVQASLTAHRAAGSTMVNPVVNDGRHIRFAGNPSQLTADQYGHAFGTWQEPRIAYLQHNTDPVVWWSTDLLFTTPSWLAESREPGTPMSRMSWMPFVTFWQVTGDMAVANNVDGGYGHRYFETETVPAWAGVLGLSPAADYSRIEAAIKTANQG